MKHSYYPFRHHHSKRDRYQKNGSSAQNLAYFKAALECLQVHPERIDIIRQNLHHYQHQRHLPNSAKAAIKRFEYLLDVTHDPQEIAQHILEDSYEGRKFRQLPLLVKGVCKNKSSD